MNVRMEVTFVADEMNELAKAEYVRLFGQPPQGYKLYVTGPYSATTVETVQDKTPEPEEVIPVVPPNGQPVEVAVATT
jgi:hypothetical protein